MFRILQQLPFPGRPKFFSVDSFFVILVKIERTVSVEPFVFIPFASTVLSNKSPRTRRYFTASLSLDYLYLHFGLWQLTSFTWNYAKQESTMCTKVLNIKIVSLLILVGC